MLGMRKRMYLPLRDKMKRQITASKSDESPFVLLIREKCIFLGLARHAFSEVNCNTGKPQASPRVRYILGCWGTRISIEDNSDVVVSSFNILYVGAANVKVYTFFCPRNSMEKPSTIKDVLNIITCA